YPSAPVRAQRRRQRGSGAGRKPHLDPFLARAALRGARRLHVRRCATGKMHRRAARGFQSRAHRGAGTAARAESLSGKKTIAETLHDGVSVSYDVDEVLHQEATGQHRLALVRNQIFGKLLMLDGAVQVTTADEFI